MKRLLLLLLVMAITPRINAADVNKTLYWHPYEVNREYYEADVRSFDSIDITVTVVCDTDFNGDEFEIINSAGDRLYYFDAGAFGQPPKPAGSIFTYNVHGPSGPAGNGPRFNPNSPPTVLIPAALRSYTYGNRVGYATGGAITINYGQQAGATGPVGIHYTAATTIHVGLAPDSAPPPGAGTTCPNEKVGGTQPTCGSCGGATPPGPPMAGYSIHSMLVSLNIQDTPLRYSPPFGPAVNFTVTYNQKETQQPGTFSYSNLGPKWTFNWLSYITDSPTTQLPLIGVYTPSGGAEVFKFDQTSQSFTADAQSHATLVKTSAASYERRMPDGSKEVFDLIDSTSYPRRIFMTKMVDAAGQPLDIGYDSSFRVRTLTVAGQVTQIDYELVSDPLKITKVSEQFATGRSASFSYSNGRLTTITDEIGIQSTFTYDPSTDSIDSLTTPYGTTRFVSGEDGTSRWIEATDPLGGQERVEYREQTPGIGSNEPTPNAAGITNAGLDRANTFYWDKKAMLVAPRDYTQAQVTHWLRNADGSVSGIPSSKKQPLENRVWYTYLGQLDYLHAGPSANPSQIARVLADGSTQLSQFEYDNSFGKMTKSTDPVGRVMSYTYDTNQIDLLEIRQKTGTNNELLRTFTYNGLHEPLTDKDAAGQVAISTYNARGQILTRTNAKNEQTTYAYGGTVPDGYLESVTSPAFNGSSAVTAFAYDAARRVRTITNVADNYIITTDYDNLDRKIKVTYPDATFEEFKYTDNVTGAMTLDLTGSSDRRGLWTYRHYDANRHMDSITDPENRTTLYGWCTCGSLTSITDPNGNVTMFNRDIQNRVYEKVYQADGTKITYLYEGQTAPNTTGATSRLKSSTDAKNQRTNYLYYGDDNLQQVSYANALLPTPTVNYIYDSNYNRVTSMTDGIGTTNYTYYPVASGTLGAGKLHTTSGPFQNSTITLGYDELGRVTTQDINGAPASMTYDSLDRAGASSNALGSFSRTYDGVTPRLLALNYPNGQHSSYTYFDNLHDRRLKTIQNVFGAPPNLTSPLSRHDYTYDATGRIQTWNKTLGDNLTGFSFGYDNADQLTSVGQGRTRYTYEYDEDGNRLVDAFSISGRIQRNGGNFYTANGLNELDSVTRNPGSGPVSGPFPITYDANGNMTDDGGNRTFEWDAANRLVTVNYKDAGSRTEFVYDGLSRRVKILEYDSSQLIEPPPFDDPFVFRAQAVDVNDSSQQVRVTLLGLLTSTKTFVWSGNTIAEERDPSGAVVTKRFFAEGEQRVGGGDAGNYYYSRDHLGSVREVTDASGVMKAQFDYDAWGSQVVVTGNMSFDFGFTGHYRHAASNLYLALYRAYDPIFGRWLNRDPIAEEGGLNLYRYGANDPINRTDLLGLEDMMARVTQIVGTVLWYPNPGLANPTPLPARLGMIVNFSAGEAIRTKDCSRCELTYLKDGTITRLGSNTILAGRSPRLEDNRLLHVPR